ncbi:hypothetical protein FX985_02893 [Pseudomonas extremaustralis]|uniref:Uncharacterized protein n=1 Tax=Pseudomonas extremaustralis TaxID=359110 RepID=A0A5M9J2F1_9PSED|nr:hypothetical protein FX985_02893 [Pseudomonas extremaustralis]
MTPIQDKGTTSIALAHEALHIARERGLELTIALANADIDPNISSNYLFAIPTKLGERQS